MTHEPTTFGDVRAIAQGEPSAGLWFALCSALERWEDQRELEEVVVPYLRSYMQRWPDDDRVVPDRWIPDYLSGALGVVGELPRKLFMVSRLKEPGVFESLLDATLTRHLTRLFLGWNHLDSDRIFRLSRRETFSGLTHLSLRGNGLYEHGVDAVVSGRWAEQLEWLDLACLSLTREHLSPLKRAGALPALRHLDLSQNPLGSWVSFKGTVIERVESLNLGGAALGDAGVSAMAGSCPDMRPRALDLSGNEIGDVGVRALIEGGLTSGLRALDLTNNRVGDAGVRMLASSPASGRIERLSLSGNAFGLDGVRALASSPNLGGLQWLEIHRLSPEATETLARSEHLPAHVTAKWR
jgi:hypothetical protein